MSKRSRESIIAELDAAHIGYKDEMRDEDLAGLLKEAKKKEKAEEKKAMEDEPLNIDYTGVKCGISTIHDFHRRITIIERKLKLK